MAKLNSITHEQRAKLRTGLLKALAEALDAERFEIQQSTAYRELTMPEILVLGLNPNVVHREPGGPNPNMLLVKWWNP